MKLLLDECIDQRFATALEGHETRTVPQMGWANFKNGQLLDVAQHDFDVFITVDRNLPHQQNLARFTLAIVILRTPSNRLSDLMPLVPLLLVALPDALPGQAIYVGG